ncbi:hypothetical protein [Amycolatopsis minnesotensis]|uniref:Uncharacterized protein n=1 Tax=Amycolatopsis minnesotensis TaxID=337894 RepID=A0ABP5D0I8_9PSEU
MATGNPYDARQLVEHLTARPTEAKAPTRTLDQEWTNGWTSRWPPGAAPRSARSCRTGSWRRRRGLTVHVTNAVSCFDGIWADLTIEPFFGFSVWEATAFVKLGIEPDTAVCAVAFATRFASARRRSVHGAGRAARGLKPWQPGGGVTVTRSRS